jgi:hypothetical protein
MIRRTLARGLAVSQGLFYMGTGIWPIVHMRSFQKVTGPKTDDWLVNTVGAAVTVTGATLVLAGVRGRVTPEIFLLATGSAAALGTIDVVYVAKGTISPIYLADAVAEAGIIGAWLLLYPFSGAGRR